MMCTTCNHLNRHPHPDSPLTHCATCNARSSSTPRKACCLLATIHLNSCRKRADNAVPPPPPSATPRNPYTKIPTLSAPDRRRRPPRQISTDTPITEESIFKMPERAKKKIHGPPFLQMIEEDVPYARGCMYCVQDGFDFQGAGRCGVDGLHTFPPSHCAPVPTGTCTN